MKTQVKRRYKTFNEWIDYVYSYVEQTKGYTYIEVNPKKNEAPTISLEVANGEKYTMNL